MNKRMYICPPAAPLCHFHSKRKTWKGLLTTYRSECNKFLDAPAGSKDALDRLHKIRNAIVSGFKEESMFENVSAMLVDIQNIVCLERDIPCHSPQSISTLLSAPIRG